MQNAQKESCINLNNSTEKQASAFFLGSAAYKGISLFFYGDWIS